VKTKVHEIVVCLEKARPMPIKKCEEKQNAKECKINGHARDHPLKDKIKALQKHILQAMSLEKRANVSCLKTNSQKDSRDK